MPDLLLEVLSEEIPARMQAADALAIRQQVRRQIEEARLTHEGSKTFATPRRLALLVTGLPAVQPDITVERKGPRVDAPEKAIQGFLKSTGLTLDDCEQRETPKGPVWFAIKQEKGRPTGDLLADLLPEALAAVSWPKSMRWEESGTRWVRPIRSILCLLGGDVVSFRFGAVESGRTTLGHRFLKPGPHTIEHASDYVPTLENAKVMLDTEERKARIIKDAEALANQEGLSLAEDDWLVGENAGLVEWPVVLMGTIDKQFMSLPTPILRSAMRTHQRYFGVLDEENLPTARFVMVSNIDSQDEDDASVSDAVRIGNERVLRARLADARFFWEQDKRQKFEEHLPALDGVVFHTRLGSMADKALRIAKLAGDLLSEITGADPKQAARAGLLCKADLVTETVGEFPDLQGLIGSFLAQNCKEDDAVIEAILEHYEPRGADALCPATPEGRAVALADKLDTLVGFFTIEEQPTGSKDPFALRRAALGTIRIIIEHDLRLPLRSAFAQAMAGYGDLLPAEPGPETTSNTLLDFFADRLKRYLHARGARHDLVSAVFAVSGEDDLRRLRARALALARFLDTEDGINLLTAYRRAANILRIEEKKDGAHYDGEPEAALFAEAEERALHRSIVGANFDAKIMLKNERFEEAMAAMATLRGPVDDFFDNVTVNCDDPALRRNRLLMLSQIRATLDRVADFSKIEG